MTPEEIRHLIASTVHAADPSAEVILYGSRARGDARPDSDWDVLILLDQPEKPDYRKKCSFTDPLYDLSVEAGIHISPKVYAKDTWKQWYFLPFYKNVMKEGIKL